MCTVREGGFIRNGWKQAIEHPLEMVGAIVDSSTVVILASHECHFHVGHPSELALAASYSEAPCLSCASRGNRSKDPCSVNNCTQLQRVRCVQSYHECLSKVWVNACHMWVHCTDATLDSLRKSQGKLSSQEAGPQTVCIRMHWPLRMPLRHAQTSWSTAVSQNIFSEGF